MDLPRDVVSRGRTFYRSVEEKRNETLCDVKEMPVSQKQPELAQWCPGPTSRITGVSRVPTAHFCCQYQQCAKTVLFNWLYCHDI